MRNGIMVQESEIGIYSLNKKKAFISSDLKLTVAFQNVKESRHNRRFGNYNLQSREEVKCILLR
jgi:hemoglobin/transferrin/lactoferrin receptor protein